MPRRREESGELEMEIEMPLECGWDQVSQLSVIRRRKTPTKERSNTRFGLRRFFLSFAPPPASGYAPS